MASFTIQGWAEVRHKVRLATGLTGEAFENVAYLEGVNAGILRPDTNPVDMVELNRLRSCCANRKPVPMQPEQAA